MSEMKLQVDDETADLLARTALLPLTHQFLADRATLLARIAEQDAIIADMIALLTRARKVMRPIRGSFCSTECLGQCEECKVIAEVDAVLTPATEPKKENGK